MLSEGITGCYNFQPRHQDAIDVKSEIRIPYAKFAMTIWKLLP